MGERLAVAVGIGCAVVGWALCMEGHVVVGGLALMWLGWRVGRYDIARSSRARKWRCAGTRIKDDDSGCGNGICM